MKKTIEIDGEFFPVIKELEHTYVIRYGNGKRLYSKRKKRLVYAGYDEKKHKKKVYSKTLRGRNGTYDQAEHLELIPRFNKARKKHGKCTLLEIAGYIGVSKPTLSAFIHGKKVNEMTLKAIREWIIESE